MGKSANEIIKMMEEITDLYMMQCTDWTVLAESILFEISPRYSKTEDLVLHLMVCINASATENIPALDNLQFEVLHMYFVTDIKISKNYYEMQQRINDVTSIAYQELYDIFSNKVRIPELFRNAFWEKLETMLRNSEKEEARLRNAVNFDFVALDHNGDFLRNNPHRVTNKRKRQVLVRHYMDLIFSQSSMFNRIFQICIGKEKDETFGGIRPLHIGWSCHNDSWYYFGTDSNWGNMYGNLLQMSSVSISASNWDAPFKLVPDETSIPLLAYTLFSVIKPFIDGYPSRMSVKDRYCDMMRKKGIVIFMSLRGTDSGNRNNIAKAFCGFFSDYKVRPNFSFDPRFKGKCSSRVHDGVVLNTNIQKNLTSFSDGPLAA